ncbi:hypothetical protein PAXRUDRAFT_34059 [Paxillus rubicundulus Ve08.2h10]|uniref:Unplaced genomic scaffold scaffold_362, whole genome shotgun sequence n=1 Tax=Paxillus rubicundulus Ve08.2h10 TaxID=930991 RepID=A0A0D0E6S3_9AGAM|nr:hypothetical protein PAXRUDRAFT_34059 [Paxillus rubicundulus Ve08.2h10]
METHRRIPLQDLTLEQFIAPSFATTKTPRKPKRPLSPSQSTPLNPAKRRVLDTEGMSFANTITATSSVSRPVPSLLYSLHTVTPTRPSRLGNGYIPTSIPASLRPTPESRIRLARKHGSPKGTTPPFPSRRPSVASELHSTQTIESSTDPQSKHYPGFDIFRDSNPSQEPPTPGGSLRSDSGTLDDKFEDEKENIPPKRNAKKISSKKRLPTGIGDLGGSCLCSPTRKSEVVRLERTPLLNRQAPR